MKEIDNEASKADFDPVKNKKNIVRALLHAADLSNGTRITDVSKFWSFNVLEEFFI